MWPEPSAADPRRHTSKSIVATSSRIDRQRANFSMHNARRIVQIFPAAIRGMQPIQNWNHATPPMGVDGDRGRAYKAVENIDGTTRPSHRYRHFTREPIHAIDVERIRKGGQLIFHEAIFASLRHDEFI